MGIWIDTDMGFDDIAAILVVAHSHLAIDGVSLVSGNAPLSHVRANAASAAAVFDWTFPIHTGRELPVLCRLETAQSILGQTGIPTTGRSLPPAGPLPESSAFAALCDWLSDGKGPKRILALGPLTNIAALALARPDLADRIDELTWMGGGVTAGNHTASAEFNAFADPEALAIVLAHGLPGPTMSPASERWKAKRRSCSQICWRVTSTSPSAAADRPWQSTTPRPPPFSSSRG